jgi:hypothetical protein
MFVRLALIVMTTDQLFAQAGREYWRRSFHDVLLIQP